MTTLKLVGVAVLCGAFTGLRGGLFSLAMWRLNVRIRQELFKSLLAQEVGFYDTSQTGVCLLITSLDTDIIFCCHKYHNHCRRAFGTTTLKLVGVAFLCGIFAGLRGGLFTVASWRLNVRVRQELFKSLLAQEVGFYDTAQTGQGGEGMSLVADGSRLTWFTGCLARSSVGISTSSCGGA
jgi:ABC-type multidrug transport system fused ATPase/permease subunit